MTHPSLPAQTVNPPTGSALMESPFFEETFLEETYIDQKPAERRGPRKPLRGRGAVENPSGRFEMIEGVNFEEDTLAEETPEKCTTRFFKDSTRSIINYNDSPDVGFDASINPYRGCEHGCIYCYARPSHEFLGLSAGLDFETQIFAKTEAPMLLRKSLMARSWKPQVIALSGVTDPYQPGEKHFRLTRQCLEILAEFRNPVGIVTKNHLITRDIDILSEMATYQGVSVFLSITTLDETLAQRMEPRASRPALRLDAVRQLTQAGIPVSIIMGPVIPGLTDSEIDRVLKSAAEAGAINAFYTMVRLPYGVKDLFQSWLETHYPMKKSKVMSLIQSVRDGRLNDPDFESRMVGTGQYAEFIRRMFELSKKRHGLDRPMPFLSTASFRTSPEEQLRLGLF